MYCDTCTLVNDVISNHKQCLGVHVMGIGMDRVMYCDACTQVNDVISNQCLGVHVMGRYGPCDVL